VVTPVSSTAAVRAFAAESFDSPEANTVDFLATGRGAVDPPAAARAKAASAAASPVSSRAVPGLAAAVRS
jgi:hypothetical protein